MANIRKEYGKTGWLSPDGKLFECETWEHMDSAEKLVEEFGYVSQYNREDQTLLDNGWAKISIASMVEHGYVVNYHTRKLTHEQLDCLKPYIYDEYELSLIARCKRDLLRQIED